MERKIVVEYDDFNSRIFRLKFGNVIDFEENITSDEILYEISNLDFDFLGLRIDSIDYSAIKSFQKAGFYLVDCLLTYEFDSTKVSAPNNEFDIDFASSISNRDIQKLSSIAAKVFKIDRFHSDPNLSSKDSDRYYSEWVINSFNGFSDGAILPIINNNIVAFTTYNINNVDNETSTMVLSAVDSEYMGLGVYYNMIKKGTLELLKYSKKIRVGTQVDNIPVQRTWQKLGYKLVDVKYIFHFYKGVN
jgi:ribosomal protein S18 acetylase RimI-like enzyme